VSEAVAKGIAHNLLSAVQFLREKHVIHRDIQPHYILVQSKPLAAILGDFGAARHVLPSVESSEAGISNGVCAMWYRALEVFITPSHYSYPGDVWSVGITLELEVGQPPFRCSSEVGIFFGNFSNIGNATTSRLEIVWVRVGWVRVGCGRVGWVRVGWVRAGWVWAGWVWAGLVRVGWVRVEWVKEG
jgi:serine/threonine protein kinase